MWYASLYKQSLRTLLLLSLIGSSACAGNQTKESEASDRIDSAVANADQVIETAPSLPPIDIEVAETQVSLYFSQLNQQAGYPLYKHLLIRIDSLLPGPTPSDTSTILATVEGRQRKQAGADSSSMPFRQKITLKAFPQGNRWNYLPAR